jgi:hypothetical protein
MASSFVLFYGIAFSPEPAKSPHRLAQSDSIGPWLPLPAPAWNAA